MQGTCEPSAFQVLELKCVTESPAVKGLDLVNLGPVDADFPLSETSSFCPPPCLLSYFIFPFFLSKLNAHSVLATAPVAATQLPVLAC